MTSMLDDANKEPSGSWDNVKTKNRYLDDSSVLDIRAPNEGAKKGWSLGREGLSSTGRSGSTGIGGQGR